MNNISTIHNIHQSALFLPRCKLACSLCDPGFSSQLSPTHRDVNTTFRYLSKVKKCPMSSLLLAVAFMSEQEQTIGNGLPCVGWCVMHGRCRRLLMLNRVNLSLRTLKMKQLSFYVIICLTVNYPALSPC